MHSNSNEGVGNKNKGGVSNTEFLVGEAGATKALYKQIEIVAPTNYSIILNFWVKSYLFYYQ